MAAGLTIDGDKIDAFADFLEDRLAGAVTHALGERALLLDALLAPRGLTVDLVTAFDGGGPYALGWPAPRVAAGAVRIIKADVVGNGAVRAIVSGDDGGSLKAVACRRPETAAGPPRNGAVRGKLAALTV